jgi:DNA-binding MarR family transcriptional regulator
MSVLYKIKDLDLRILRMFWSDGNILCDRLTPSQVRIIAYLCENKVVYQKDIEKSLNLSRATISGILSTMEKNNIISRCVSECDLRSKEIVLNEDIKKIFDSKKVIMKKLENIIISGISKNDMDVFFSVIDKMNNNIDEYLGGNND